MLIRCKAQNREVEFKALQAERRTPALSARDAERLEAVEDDHGARLQRWGELGFVIGFEDAPVHGRIDAQGAVRPSWRSAAMKVWVPQ